MAKYTIVTESKVIRTYKVEAFSEEEVIDNFEDERLCLEHDDLELEESIVEIKEEKP